MKLKERLNMALRLVKAALSGDRDAIYDEWYALNPFSTDAVISSLIRNQKPGQRVFQFRMDALWHVSDVCIWGVSEYKHYVDMYRKEIVDSTEHMTGYHTLGLPIVHTKKPKKKKEKTKHGIRSSRRQSTGKTTRSKRRKD